MLTATVNRTKTNAAVAGGTNHWVDFVWDNCHVTFAEILEAVGELPIPPYLNRETEESDKQTYQTVYSKVKGSVAAPTAGLHFTQNVLHDIDKAGITRDELTLHVGAGTFKPVKSSEIEGHNMHSEYVVVHRHTVENLLSHNCKAIAVGTTSVRTLESLYYMGVKLERNSNATEDELHVEQWEPYEQEHNSNGLILVNGTPVSVERALQNLLSYLDNNGLTALHTSTQIIIAPGFTYKNSANACNQLPSTTIHTLAFGKRILRRQLAQSVQLCTRKQLPLPELWR